MPRTAARRSLGTSQLNVAVLPRVHLCDGQHFDPTRESTLHLRVEWETSYIHVKVRVHENVRASSCG